MQAKAKRHYSEFGMNASMPGPRNHSFLDELVHWGLLVALALWLPVALAQGIPYRSVTTHTPAYLAPEEPVPVFYLLPGTPVELIRDQGGWAQIRDADGGLYWVPSANLDPRRTVIVTVDRAEVRSAPDPEAAIVFEVERNVVLSLLATHDGWVEVAHGSLRGFISRSAVWGP